MPLSPSSTSGQPKSRWNPLHAAANLSANFKIVRALAAFRHYQATHALKDLNAAIDLAREATQAASPGSGEQAASLLMRGQWLLKRFDHSQDMDDLNMAEAALRRFVEEASPDAVDWDVCWTTLGVIAKRRFEATRQPTHLDGAIEALRNSLHHTAPSSVNLTETLDFLARILLERYDQRGDPADLEEAIVAGRDAVREAGTDSAYRCGYLSTLAQALNTRYLRFGRGDDLQAAMLCLREAARIATPGSPEHASSLNNLGGALIRMYDQTGEPALLAEAIVAWQQGLQATDPAGSAYPARLSNLAIGLRIRHEREGRLEDLDEAIGYLRQALDASDAAAPERASRLHNLGICLAERYDLTRRNGDLDEAVPMLREAVRLLPQKSEELPNALLGLANALDQRFERDRARADLDAAIDTYRMALKATPPGSPRTSALLAGFAASLGRSFELSGERKTIDEAVRLAEKAVAEAPQGSPDRPGYFNNLALALRSRYDRLHRADDLPAAERAFEAGCSQSLELNPALALRSAHNWGHWAFDRADWPGAARAFGYGMAALDRLVRVQLLRRGKEDWLEAAQRLPSRAAYALARCDRLEEAVLALEQGKARLLSLALQRERADLDALAGQHADLRAAYLAAAQRTAELESQELRRQRAPAEVIADLRTAQAELAAAVKAIRLLPGYESFLADPDFADVAAAAHPGAPLVYLASTSAGGMALLVEPGRSATPAQASVLWLPDLLEARLRQAVNELLSAGAAWRRTPADEIKRRAWQNTLDRTTRWLWDAAMGPLAERSEAPQPGQAGATQSPGERAITLVPAGLLGLLPLHAAWTEDPTAPTGRRYALDGLTIAYAPNARSLAAARRIASTTPAAGLLVVDNPDGTLRFSHQEAAAVLAAFSDVPATSLQGGGATLQAVLKLLPKFPVYHLSTHGWAGWQDPLQGGLRLAGDSRLTLADVLALRLAGARLAVLSACDSGLPGARLPDEVIGLPSGLLQAGVAGVVASLWPVDDLGTAILMERFYRLWRTEGLAPASALVAAQRWLRDSTNQELVAYFEHDLAPASQPRMPAAVAADLAVNRMSCDPAGRDFAHPVWWAAFTMTGA